MGYDGSLALQSAGVGIIQYIDKIVHTMPRADLVVILVGSREQFVRHAGLSFSDLRRATCLVWCNLSTVTCAPPVLLSTGCVCMHKAA